MSNDIKFDTDVEYNSRRKQKYTGMVRFTIRYSGGFIKNEEQANNFLIGLVAILFIVTFFLFIKAMSAPSSPPLEFRGNIPNTPEYQNPPWPEDFR